MAKELDIETPVSESVYALIKAIESKYLDEGEISDEAFTLAVDELLSTINQH